ncbi:MAG: RNA 2',3'-cyclic phosphodiesterase [Coriobacteriaceae bacterium]|nr:RNA 2',3'-cyclic phosphodiesterase [Coriobacteriaceae bacterium]
MRLFIAAELPQELLEALSETSARLRDAVPGRYVPPSNFHVTLAFLGETDAARVAELAELLEDACAGFGPIPVSLGALGSFGKARRATLWQAVESDGVLETLAESVRKGLARQGFSFDEKGFLAHMTLMRSADISCGELPMPQVAWGSVEDVSLFKSDLSGKLPVYTPLHTVRLA